MTDENAPEGGSAIPPLTPAPMRTPAAVAEPETSSTPFGPTTGIAHPIPIPQKQAEWESGYQNEHGPRPSRWESWVQAPFDKSTHGSIASPWGGALERMFEKSQSKSGRMMSPDQANKNYPGRPVPYTTPIDQGIAEMEFNDRQRQQDLAEWSAQRETTVMGRVTSTASGFVGGLTDPLNLAVGAMSAGVGELVAPEAAPLMVKAITHYLSNLGGFSAADALQNYFENKMGAKQKQFPEIVGENVVPAAVMTGIGVAFGAAARKFGNEAGGTSEADINGIKKTVAALEQDRKPPLLTDDKAVLAERKAGVTQPDPGGEKIKPTLLTSPIQETSLYAATHSDGSPLVHEHGLGPGTQFTDSHEVANNGVSRSTETPGQIGETKLPSSAKLLDLDKSASEDYHSQNSLLKEIEAKTGIPLDSAVQNGESLKEAITNLGDWAGAELGDGKVVPEDILKKIQEIAKSKGFDGYLFNGGLPGEATNRQVHMFDTSGMAISKSYSANPTPTPALPDTVAPEMEGAQPAQTQNPAMDKAQSKFYSPEIEKLAHEFRKGKTFDPYSPEAQAEAQKDIELYKQQLADLSDTSETAAKALEDLRKQEAQDSRLRDIAKRISECGSGGGI